MTSPVEQEVLRNAVSDLITDRVDQTRAEAAEGGYSPTLWRALSQSGFATVLVPESLGGSGGTVADLAVVLRAAGGLAAPVPLAEHNVAAHLLAESGSPDLPQGPLITAVVPTGSTEVRLERSADGARLTGALQGVPWVGAATGALVVARAGETDLIGLWPEAAEPLDLDVAGEPQGTLSFGAAGMRLRRSPVGVDQVTALTTLTRALLITAAVRKVLTLTSHYAATRTQFGRPIGAFQVIRHKLADLATTAEVADAIVDQAVTEVSAGTAAAEVLLAAKVCAGEAATTAIAIGHQVHGAIGVTEEHELHHHTRRLMAWRDRDGADHQAALQLGQAFTGHDPDAFWQQLTDPAGAERW